MNTPLNEHDLSESVIELNDSIEHSTLGPNYHIESPTPKPKIDISQINIHDPAEELLCDSCQ